MQNKEIPHKQSGTNVCVITRLCNAHKLTAVRVVVRHSIARQQWVTPIQGPEVGHTVTCKLGMVTV